MGLLGNLIEKVGTSKVGKAIFKPGGVVDTITKPIQAVGVVVSNPITTITKGYDAAKQKVLTDSVEKSIGKVALNTGIAAAAVLTGGTALGRTAAVSVAKVAAKNPIKTGVAVLAAPAVATAVVSNPKIITEAAKLPSKSAAFGADVGTFTKEPTLENAINIVQENPLISTLVAGGAIAAGAGSIVTGIGALENIKTRESVQDLTKSLSELPKTTQNPAVVATPKAVTTDQTPFTPTTAVTPATASLSKTRSKYKTKKKQIPTTINQKVNVIVQNKNTATGLKQSKNYLKRSVYA